MAERVVNRELRAQRDRPAKQVGSFGQLATLDQRFAEQAQDAGVVGFKGSDLAPDLRRLREATGLMVRSGKGDGLLKVRSRHNGKGNREKGVTMPPQLDRLLNSSDRVEHLSETPGKHGVTQQRGTESGTLGGDSGFADAVAAIMRLQLSDTEKAEAVRRLLR